MASSAAVQSSAPAISPQLAYPVTSTAAPPIPVPGRTSSHPRSPADVHGSRSASGGEPASSGYTIDSASPAQYSPSAATATAQARNRGLPSPREAPLSSPRSGSARQPQSPGHSRSANAVGQPPMGTDLPREDSTIINRLVITDPQEDIAREKERAVESRPIHADSTSAPRTSRAPAADAEPHEESTRSSRTRQERSDKRPKEMRFGDYILGQTLGEGEFGKVKMGWKREGGVQVAIKLIRRDTLGNNPNRLPKIYREIAILRGLQHPNIVRLHEMVETERHIGIILEYASGGELFDYILQHRFLKDNSARRLFAQLVSGVGYLHKKGIVHRDLKLENLLLDRNRNIIITDFGFANTFNPMEELTEEVEYNLGNKDYVRKMGLDVVHEDGHRRGDLMQTSCGSPCYAAPELVVSDGLYTGRKVDVWSCGVILYAMLAGYLPFDDDPANPEGDNINLLYKYIVTTPLTFPEYVTPHARDLLKRILVPDPRKRADLFEIARHSWLSEYAHVVAFITSSTTSPNEISNTTVPAEDAYEPHLARSASVREPTKGHSAVPAIGGIQKQQGQINEDKGRSTRDAKRRTVQVEYVAPSSATARGEQSKTRARSDAQPVEVQAPDPYSRQQQRVTTAPTSMLPSVRPTRDQPRATSEHVSTALGSQVSATRPSTGGSMSGNRLPSRGNSYGQPAVAAVAKDTAQGHFSQPPRGTQYHVTSPVAPAFPESESQESEYYPEKPGRSNSKRGHKRSSTLGELFGKRGSIFGGGKEKVEKEKPSRSHPPVSMKQPLPADAQEPRRSTDSRRPSFSFNRKNKDASDVSHRSSRRFSFLPTGLTSTLGVTSSRNSTTIPPDAADSENSQHNRRRSRARMAFGRGESRSPSRSTTASTIPVLGDTTFDRNRPAPQQNAAMSQIQDQYNNVSQHNRLPSQTYAQQRPDYDGNMHFQADPAYAQHQEYPSNSGQMAAPLDAYNNNQPQYATGPIGSEEQDTDSIPASRRSKPGLQRHKQFPDDKHGGKAKRVMDFFRVRGKARTEA